jgi:signal transduction histidine kinase
VLVRAAEAERWTSHYSAAMAARPTWRSLALDVGPVVALTLVALLLDYGERFQSPMPTLVFVVAPLLVRRYVPLAVLLFVALGTLLTAANSPTPVVQVLSVALASATLGAAAGPSSSERTRHALIVVAVASFLVAGLAVLGADAFEAVVLPFVILLPSWLAGDVLRMRRLDALERVAAVERSMREQEERMRAAAAEERRHMARELHDVVAHAVSVMIIQAGAARQVLRSSPDEAESSLLAVEATGREAMTELRRFLGALADDEAGGLAPQPGIGALGSLVERVREAGLPASLEVDGQPVAVPASLDVTVYRIVQEALTNALRYARHAATLVRLSWEPEQLRLEILDEGPAAAASASEGAGRGLTGMRDRASLVGGRVEAGPRVGGGYAVRAWLPLSAPPLPEAG